MKSITTILSFFILFCNPALSQEIKPEHNELINHLEKAFKMRTIQHIHPYLATDFRINENTPSFSLQMLAGLIIELPIKKIKSRKFLSDSSGIIRVTSKMVIAKYGGIFSQPIELTLTEKDNQYLIQEMELLGQNGEGIGVTVEVDNDGEIEQKEVKLEELEKIENDGAPTYFEKGSDSIATAINSIQVEGLKIAKHTLNEEILFKLGFLLMNDDMSNMSINEAVLPIVINNETDDDQELADIITYWVYFHEVTELHLLLGNGILDPKTRWFRDGLADYVAHKVAQDLNPRIDSIVMTERIASYEPIKGNAQLLKWIGTGSEKKQTGIEGGSGQYAAAMLFFIDLTERYGEEIIPQLLSKLLLHKKISSRVIVKELSKLTGSNMKKMIKSY